MTGTEILTSHATHVRAAIGVIGSARTPYRDLLAAVGLSRGGAKGNVFTTGAVTWKGGVATADLQQGSATCSDSTALGPETVFLTSAGGTPRGAVRARLWHPRGAHPLPGSR